MEPLRCALILVIAISVFLAVNATRCYDCISKEPALDTCSKPQNPSTSYSFDCDGLTKVTRSCLIGNISCEALEKISQVKLTNCTVCDTDLCNGE
nr:unnamed protein product [Callosobruchus chinensis]